jgi:hypothetical protein
LAVRQLDLGEFPLCQANQDASPSIYSNWRTANHLNFENIVVQKNKKKNPKRHNGNSPKYGIKYSLSKLSKQHQ